MPGQIESHRGLNGRAAPVLATETPASRTKQPKAAAVESDGPATVTNVTAARRRRYARTMADAGKVRARLLGAIDRQVGMIDARLMDEGTEIEERDSRILANLAKTLSTLMEIEEGGKTSKDREPPERDDAEDRLAERIKRWARGGE
jgi:hypothetical protein